MRDADEATIRYIARAAGLRCVYCKGPGGTVDHIVALARGGRHHWRNLLPACRSCNSRKSDRDVLEFLGVADELRAAGVIA